MKRALIVTTVSGFVPQFEMENVRILQNMGYEVHYASNYNMPSYSGNNSKLNGTGIIRHQIDFSRSPYSFINIKAYRQLKVLMLEEKYQLVHCHTPMGGVLGRLAAHSTHTGPVVYTAHGFHFYRGASLRSWFIYYPVEKYLSRYTDVQITINSEDFERAKGFHSRHVEFIHGVGVDNKVDDVDYIEKRRQVEIKPDEFIIISAGELNKNKNQKLILAALYILKKRGMSSIRLLICGSGPKENCLRRKAQKLGILNQVSFLGYREDLKELMQISNVFVMSSYREGLPTVVMEAMCCKLPVIGTDIRGNRDLIIDGKSGYLVPINKPDIMALKLESFFHNRNLGKQMGEYGNKVVRNYSKDSVTEEMSKIYKSL